jgi:hypothetical protein
MLVQQEPLGGREVEAQPGLRQHADFPGMQVIKRLHQVRKKGIVTSMVAVHGEADGTP